METSKSGSISGSEALTDELRKEISILKGRIEGLEKDLMNQELELKAAKISLKDKNNDPMMIKNLSVLFQQFSIHLGDMQEVHKEMDKMFQIHKTTWDLKLTKNSLTNTLESSVLESKAKTIYHSTDKDKNNNSKVVYESTRLSEKSSKVSEQESIQNSFKTKSDTITTTSTLKRKRDAKSPSTKVVVESDFINTVTRKQSSNIATILVSKTKTKTGLPLMLKKEWKDR